MGTRIDIARQGRSLSVVGNLARGGLRDAGPILIVDDDPTLAQALHDQLDDAGFAPLPPCTSYEAALRFLINHRPRLCVLEIDLGRSKSPLPGVGESGHRLLALLRSRLCRTLVYTRSPHQDPALLRGLDPQVSVLQKSAPPSAVIRHLSQCAAA